ncbi:hypothetical protein E1I69_07045 [Bacillus timonensis]|uniref:Lipoprotein n=1 Tax=Bacillus timonensis TaxID=1033734 RepID=A0A4V3V858_9BACI|nr:hypothetical protein [Bacillus timonensis]THE13663.1 hypothetical protein E1I69_07045 [Bacillus timonensis]
MKQNALKTIPFFIVFLFLISGCSYSYGIDINYIQQYPDKYSASTLPYEGKIEFSLSTEEILNGIEEPQKITTIYDTDVFLIDITEDENTINNEQEILVIVGFDSHINSNEGTLLSQYEVNEDNSITTGSVNIKAFGDDGELGSFGTGSGDFEGKYEQHVMYVFNKDDLFKSKKWKFEISGLHLLTYSKK